MTRKEKVKPVCIVKVYTVKSSMGIVGSCGLRGEEVVCECRFSFVESDRGRKESDESEWYRVDMISSEWYEFESQSQAQTMKQNDKEAAGPLWWLA